MEHDRGASRAAVTGAFTIGMGVAALAALPVAVLARDAPAPAAAPGA
jgi:hypothetical protein